MRYTIVWCRASIGENGFDVRIRGYGREDAAGIAHLFYETVRSVNLADYSPKQVRAWAPEIPDSEVWHERMSGRCTLVVEDGGIIAFVELEVDGHLNMFYCRWDAVGRGVGLHLYEVVEQEAWDLSLRRSSAEASITARSFFERRGFAVLRADGGLSRGRAYELCDGEASSE